MKGKYYYLRNPFLKDFLEFILIEDGNHVPVWDQILFNEYDNTSLYIMVIRAM